jgi:cation diffusion facilitator family transporter
MSTEHTIRKVTWTGLAANLLLAAVKFAAGYWGKSQALIADAVHSLTDMVTDVAVIAGSHFWARPPDQCHPYGHRRLETLITVCIGAVLAAAGVSIGWDALTRLKQDSAQSPGWIAAVTAALSIVSKEILYRWTASTGRRLRSSALAANAWHHRTDAISSIPVLVAVGGSILFPDWSFLDGLGAVVVSLFILQAAFRILWPGVRELIDSGAPVAVQNDIARIAGDIDGVLQVHDIRTRYISSSIQVDLHIVVKGSLSVREGHSIADAVQLGLIRELPDIIDVVVHVDPPESAK